MSTFASPFALLPLLLGAGACAETPPPAVPSFVEELQVTATRIPRPVNVGQVHSHLVARAGYSLHDSRFRDYLTEFGGTPTQLAGNRFEMSPRHLGSLALSWSPEQGLFASADLAYVGDRYLNKRNTALAGAYATVGASLGYRTSGIEIRATGRNLSDRRDPVSESELGDAQYYRLPPRRVDVAVTLRP